MTYGKKLIRVKLYFDDGTIDEIDDILDVSMDTNDTKTFQLKIDANKYITFADTLENIKYSGELWNTVTPIQQTVNCSYLLPCGHCDKYDKLCSQFAEITPNRN